MAIQKVIWNESYSTGVADVDRQHRNLIDILNELNLRSGETMSARQVQSRLWKKFDELNEYAAYHFLTEEKLMQSHLPTETSTARHIAQHRNYWVTISEFKTRDRDGDTQVIGDLIVFLNKWWIEHILGIDAQMGRELNQKGVR